MELHILPVEDLPKYQGLLIPYIDSFVESAKGRYNVEDVLNNVRDGWWKVWVVHENADIKAVLMTQVIEYPRLRDLQIIMCVGREHKDWYFLRPKLEEYARLIGCRKITAITRLGWKRIMKEYENSFVYLERDL